MPYRLLKYALSKEYPEGRMFRAPKKLKGAYDAVIIGGGGGMVWRQPTTSPEIRHYRCGRFGAELPGQRRYGAQHRP